MILSSLNTWRGKLINDISEYLRVNKSKTDIFLFQEVTSFPSDREMLEDWSISNVFEEITEELGQLFDSKTAFSPNQFVSKNGNIIQLDYGLCVFVNKRFRIIKSGHWRTLYESKLEEIPHNLITQYIILEDLVNLQKFLVVNEHGAWIPNFNFDHQLRHNKLKRIVLEVKKLNLPTIIAGDFNIVPQWPSIKILETESDMINLNQRFGVNCTRPSFYNGENTCVDYIFVTQEILVNSFQAASVEISDHLPLRLDFDLR